ALYIEFKGFRIVRFGLLDSRLLAHQLEDPLEENPGFTCLLLQVCNLARIVAGLIDQCERIAIVVARHVAIVRFRRPRRLAFRWLAAAAIAACGGTNAGRVTRRRRHTSGGVRCRASRRSSAPATSTATAAALTRGVVAAL